MYKAKDWSWFRHCHSQSPAPRLSAELLFQVVGSDLLDEDASVYVFIYPASFHLSFFRLNRLQKIHHPLVVAVIHCLDKFEDHHHNLSGFRKH